jgi:hypothetical protein
MKLLLLLLRTKLSVAPVVIFVQSARIIRSAAAAQKLNVAPDWGLILAKLSPYLERSPLVIL